MGVMLSMLSGNRESVDAFAAAIGKRIASLEVVRDEGLRLWFDDGTGLAIDDDGQSCCESRYMTTDDDLSAFVGATLTSAEVREAPGVEDKYGEHETQFLVVTTSLGAFTCCTHNEHNGYYGGFAVRAKPLVRGEVAS